MSNHIAVTELMSEADSYHRFWIEERDKRIALEKRIDGLMDALDEIAGGLSDVRAVHRLTECKIIAQRAIASEKGEA